MHMIYAQPDQKVLNLIHQLNTWMDAGYDTFYSGPGRVVIGFKSYVQARTFANMLALNSTTEPILTCRGQRTWDVTFPESEIPQISKLLQTWITDRAKAEKEVDNEHK